MQNKGLCLVMYRWHLGGGEPQTLHSASPETQWLLERKPQHSAHRTHLTVRGRQPRQGLVLMSLSLGLSTSQRRPLPARIFPCDSNFPSTAALETLMKFVSLEAAAHLRPDAPDPRCWVGLSWLHKDVFPTT